MIVCSAGRTDIGLIRSRNEDDWTELPDLHLYALADGMGGHNAGDIAAQTAVATAAQFVRHHFGEESGQRLVAKALEAANEAVFSLSKTDWALKGMGTTLCLLLLELEEGCAYLGHVGDSRIYLLRKGELTQLTEDHARLSRQVLMGLVTKKTQTASYKHKVTRAVGTHSKVLPSLGVVEAKGGDLFLLCSDGLSDQLPAEQIAAILALPEGVEERAAALIKAATAAGGEDNTTVVLIEIHGENLSR